MTHSPATTHALHPVMILPKGTVTTAVKGVVRIPAKEIVPPIAQLFVVIHVKDHAKTIAMGCAKTTARGPAKIAVQEIAGEAAMGDVMEAAAAVVPGAAADVQMAVAGIAMAVAMEHARGVALLYAEHNAAAHA